MVLISENGSEMEMEIRGFCPASLHPLEKMFIGSGDEPET